MMQMSIFVCGNQTEEFSQLVEVLSSFIILFVENVAERSINAPMVFGLLLVTSSCRKSNASGGA